MLSIIIHRLILIGILATVWGVLSGIFTPLFLAFGTASVLATLWISLRMGVIDDEGHPYHLAFTISSYWLWLVKEMLVSGVSVTRQVWSPALKISPQFAWIEEHQKNDLGRTIYANSITLTPGTVCVDVVGGKILVHALEEQSIVDLRAGDMGHRVAGLSKDSTATGKLA